MFEYFAISFRGKELLGNESTVLCVRLEFELRALHLLGKCSTIRTILPAIFVIGFFFFFSDRVLTFFAQDQLWTVILLPMPPT
jgi:hypothetical protein